MKFDYLTRVTDFFQLDLHKNRHIQYFFHKWQPVWSTFTTHITLPFHFLYFLEGLVRRISKSILQFALMTYCAFSKMFLLQTTVWHLIRLTGFPFCFANRHPITVETTALLVMRILQDTRDTQWSPQQVCVFPSFPKICWLILQLNNSYSDNIRAIQAQRTITPS